MARLEKEARERERQRQLAETKEIQKKHALERIEQLKKSELGARVVQKIDEEVSIPLIAPEKRLLLHENMLWVLSRSTSPKHF